MISMRIAAEETHCDYCGHHIFAGHPIHVDDKNAAITCSNLCANHFANNNPETMKRIKRVARIKHTKKQKENE